MKLPEYVRIAIEDLEKNGFEAVVVGGAVRDFLLHKTPSDYDVSTNALPEQVKAVFSPYRTVDTGIRHGTVTVLIGHHQLEITTYRSEGAYRDFRHPDTVTFVSDLKTDLLRRDFTVNAICYNRRIIDLVGGISDLDRRLIRAIGLPTDRFHEDPLRILRAIRFCSDLGFGIEDNTKTALFASRELIAAVSQERIQGEWNKLITGLMAPEVIDEYRDIIRVFLPEIAVLDLSRILPVLRKTDSNLSRRLAVFYSNLSLDDVTGLMQRMKYSKAMIRDVLFYLSNRQKSLDNAGEMIQALKMYSYPEMMNLLKFQKAFAEETVPYEQKRRLLETVYQERSCYRIRDLKTNGSDLLALGYPEGVVIGEVLKQLLSDVIEGRTANTKEALLQRAEALKNEFYHQ